MRLASMPDAYANELGLSDEQRERDLHGKVLIKGSEAPFENFRQGHLSWYMGGNASVTALQNRAFFRHDVRQQSGRHTHQGGLVIFVMAGKGHSTVNGQSVPWKKYDAILLPIIPELCEHQHFNDDVGNPAVWCAFIYEGLSHEYGNDVRQNQDSPDFSKL